MKDIDGNFCDGNGRLLAQTGEEWQDKLRRERDQPKKQELPPLDEECLAEIKRWTEAPCNDWSCCAKYAELSCRERQLLAALSDKEALRAKLKSVEGMAKELLTDLSSRMAQWTDTRPDEWIVKEWISMADRALARIREAVKGDK